MPQTGLLHYYSHELTAFEHGDGKSNQLVILIPGLNGSLPAVGYSTVLAEALQNVGWCLAEVLLSSAGAGWGGSSVMKDAEELSRCVRYFKEQAGKDKVVLMGHSTGGPHSCSQMSKRDMIERRAPRTKLNSETAGCQDVIAYHHLLKKVFFRSLAGSIIQAPVSDREIGQHMLDEEPELKDTPSPLVPSPPATDLDFIPHRLSELWGATAGITYRRWNSLLAKPSTNEIDLDQSEDFFSSDMSPARWKNVFAPVESPLLVLLSEKDEAYPPSVDVEKLMPMFKEALGNERWNKESRIVPGATHAVDSDSARKMLLEAVTRFVQQL